LEEIIIKNGNEISLKERESDSFSDKYNWVNINIKRFTFIQVLKLQKRKLRIDDSGWVLDRKGRWEDSNSEVG
jgi:hypothetical protein